MAKPNTVKSTASVATLEPGKKNLVLIKHDKITGRDQDSLYRWASHLQQQLGEDNIVIVVPPGTEVEIIPLSVENTVTVGLKDRKDAKWNF